MHQGRRPVKSIDSGSGAEGRASHRGFTLVEVLIAMAITAFVSVLSYQTLSTAITGQRPREAALFCATENNGKKKLKRVYKKRAQRGCDRPRPQ